MSELLDKVRGLYGCSRINYETENTLASPCISEGGKHFILALTARTKYLLFIDQSGV